jgi:hypothetical protein
MNVLKIFIGISILSLFPFVGFAQTFQLRACGENSESISYAHIQNLNNGEKTLSNADGSFVLDLRSDSDLVKISHIGFGTREFKASELLANRTICLESQDFELSEIVVGSLSEFEFLQKGIQNTEAKIQNPSKLEAYYKEFVSLNGEYTHFSDAPITFFVQKSGDKLKIEAEVKESRAFELPKTEELSLDIISPIGFKEGMELYFPSDIKRFLSVDGNQRYSYSLTETQDEWIVEANPIENSESSFIGYVSFHKSDTTLSRVSMKISKDRLHLVKSVNLLGYTIKVEGFELDIIYIKNEVGNIYPALIRMDHMINVSNKKSLNQSYSFVSDLQLTGLLKDQNPIPKSNQYTKKSLYKRGTDFQTEYWKNKSVLNLTNRELEVIEQIGKVEGQ